jgi:phenylacetate-CoA ligase
MNNPLLSLSHTLPARLSYMYQRMPAPLRSTAATIRGLQLRYWYYGPETERLVSEAREREHWCEEQWRTWQDARLADLLRRAATKVPHYRDYWEARRRRGDRASWEYLENWPVLEKEALRSSPQNFLAEDARPKQMFFLHTSGTSGKPLNLWSSRDTLHSWYGLLEARSRLWYGVTRRDRWARLGGQLVTSVHQRKPPFWVWNAALNQLYMSSYHLAPDLVPYYLEALQKYRVKYLLGYTSSLYELAQGALQLGRRDLRMTVVTTIAEPVFDYQKQAIAEAFGCPVRETYGMTEMAAAASECDAGALHIWPEVGNIEVFESNTPVSHSTSGDLVCTGLLNADMPLIRYRVGDRGALMAAGKPCVCGRSLPRLESLEGRVDDVLYTSDGRHVGRLDPVFKSQLPIHEAQIIQEALNQVRVRYVPTIDFTTESGRSITQRLQERMGNVEVILERADKIPRGANGKFRAVICNLPAEQQRVLKETSRLTASSIK